MFKKGDKVIIKEHWNDGIVGKEGEICFVDKADEIVPYLVHFRDDDSKYWIEKNSVELIKHRTISKKETTTFEIGEEVKIVDKPDVDCKGMKGLVIDTDDDDTELPYKVYFENTGDEYWFSESEVEKLAKERKDD